MRESQNRFLGVTKIHKWVYQRVLVRYFKNCAAQLLVLLHLTHRELGFLNLSAILTAAITSQAFWSADTVLRAVCGPDSLTWGAQSTSSSSRPGSLSSRCYLRSQTLRPIDSECAFQQEPQMISGVSFTFEKYQIRRHRLDHLWLRTS